MTGTELAAIRNQYGMTQQELADLLNYTVKHIGHLERETLVRPGGPRCRITAKFERALTLALRGKRTVEEKFVSTLKTP
jgi:transcriptional regulator with XRE-family HTH domain